MGKALYLLIVSIVFLGGSSSAEAQIVAPARSKAGTTFSANTMPPRLPSYDPNAQPEFVIPSEGTPSSSSSSRGANVRKSLGALFGI